MEASPTHRAREWTDVTMLLLTIEVLSPSRRRHDRETKRRFFQRVLIPEYWTVDLVRRVVERWRPNADVPEVLDTTLFGVQGPSRTHSRSISLRCSRQSRDSGHPCEADQRASLALA